MRGVGVAGSISSSAPAMTLSGIELSANGSIRPLPRWFGNQDTGAGADTAGCGCPAVMSPARTRARIGFPVTGPNDTADGSGCRDAGDDIGRPLMGASRSPRLPLLAIAHPPPFVGVFVGRDTGRQGLPGGTPGGRGIRQRRAAPAAGFGLGRPLDIAGQSDKLTDVFSIGSAVRCLEECWVCCRPTWRSTSVRQTPSST